MNDKDLSRRDFGNLAIDVVGRHICYNNSAFDTGPGRADDDAITLD